MLNIPADVKAELEDKLTNPLNNIACLCYSTDIDAKVDENIKQIVSVLEEYGLINKRRKHSVD